MSGTTRKIDHVCATGGHYFLKRYSLFVDALSVFARKTDRVEAPEIPSSIPRRETLARILQGFPIWAYRRTPPEVDKTKTHWAFDFKTRTFRREILKRRPDLVVHLFCQSRPPGGHDTPPYVMSLDYTMALAKRDYPAWAAFPSERAEQAWLRRERVAYRDALCLFPWSRHVAESLVNDYGVDPAKVIVTGSSGTFTEPYQGDRKFGSLKLLMNASDFPRKGGDIAVSAMSLIRAAHPGATLSIVGINEGPQADGVEYVGLVNGADKMKQLFLRSDLVVAPARCEPYGSFLVEAMNFGTPCVVSRNGGMSDIVDNNRTGVVLDHNTPQALAAAVNTLLSQPHTLRAYSDAGRAKVAGELNWSAIAAKIGASVFERRAGLFRSPSSSS